MEPIALETGVPPRSLQEFIATHRWDETRMVKIQREILQVFDALEAARRQEGAYGGVGRPPVSQSARKHIRGARNLTRG